MTYILKPSGTDKSCSHAQNDVSWTLNTSLYRKDLNGLLFISYTVLVSVWKTVCRGGDTWVVHNVCGHPLRGDIGWDGDLFSSEWNLENRTMMSNNDKMTVNSEHSKGGF